jgi:oligopeptide transport system substrate-binding protein
LKLNKTWLVLLLAVVLVAALGAVVGCGGGEETTTTTAKPADQPVSGGTLSIYINEPAFIDPVNLQESEGTKVGDALFDSLAKFDPITAKLLPAAAESWSANADASVWTFKLRAGATFSDGTPVTAADFKYAWERICNPANESEVAYHLAPVKGYDEMQAGTATELSGVKAIDATTLEVTLNYGFGDFEYVVGHPALAPIPKAAVEKDPKAFADMPIGNGPFKMAEPWAHDQYIKVVRNDAYYGDKAYLDGVDFKILADEATAWLEFKAGNLDFNESVPSESRDEAITTYGQSADGLTVSPGKQYLGGPELSIYYILMNNKDELLKNAALREALSLAVNRQAISDTVYGGVRVPASSIVPEGVAGYEAGAWQYSKYDVEAAKAKLAEAGYPEGKGLPEITISFNSGSGHEDVMALIQADWAKIGVTAKLDGQEWAQYLDKLQAGEYQVGRLGWIADYPIIDNFLYPLFTPGGDDMSFYEDPAVTQALMDARKTVNTDERIAKYQAIVKTIGDAAPVIPIVIYRHHAIGSDRVRDLIYTPQGLVNFDKVWIAPAAAK